jgi:predicted PurR-regulated permease PerM
VSEPRQVVVSVSTRGLLVVGAGLLFAWALTSVASALLVIFLSFFFTLVLDPPVTALARRAGWGRGRSALIVIAALIVGGILITLALVIPLLRELRDLVKDLPQIVEQIRASDAFHWLDERVDVGAQAQQHAGTLASKVPETLAAFVGLAGNVFTFFLIIFELVFLTLFLLSELPQWEQSLDELLYPRSADRVARLRRQITTTVSRYVVGAIVIACIAGTTLGVTAAILSAPYPLALALITALLDLVPQIGATIAGVITCLVTLTVGVPQALVMAVVVIVYQQLENYVLQPTIQGKAAQISAFVVLASVVVFGALLGVLGALLAVPLAASCQIVLRELTAERRARVAAAKAAELELLA